MNPWTTVVGWAKSAWNSVIGVPADVAGMFHAAIQFGQTIVQLVVYVLSNPVEAGYVALGALVDEITGNFTAANNLINRIPTWTQRNQINPLEKRLLRMIRQLRARMLRLFHLAYLYINRKIRETRAYALALFSKERRERIRDFRRSEAYTRREMRRAIQLIQRQAAGGYAAGDQARTTIVMRLLSDIAGRDPILRGLVSRIVTGVIDLAGVEDPLARLALTFLMKEVVGKLGVDKALGSWTQGMIDSLIGKPPPKDLRQVIDDLTTRMVNVETQWAQFMTDGGPQILQAGSEWKAITNVLIDAGLLGFAVAGVADPAGTARELSALIRPVGTSTINAAATLLGKG